MVMLGAPPKDLAPPDLADDPRVGWALLKLKLLKYLCHILNDLIHLESFIILKIESSKTERGILHTVRNVGSRRNGMLDAGFWMLDTGMMGYCG